MHCTELTTSNSFLSATNKGNCFFPQPELSLCLTSPWCWWRELLRSPGCWSWFLWLCTEPALPSQGSGRGSPATLQKKKGQPQFNCCIFNVSHAGFWENFKFWTAKKKDQAELQLFKATRIFLDRKITTMPLHQTLLNSTSSLCSHWFFQLHLFYFDGLSLIKKKKRVIKSHFRTHQCIPPISSETWWQWK